MKFVCKYVCIVFFFAIFNPKKHRGLTKTQKKKKWNRNNSVNVWGVKQGKTSKYPRNGKQHWYRNFISFSTVFFFFYLFIFGSSCVFVFHPVYFFVLISPDYFPCFFFFVLVWLWIYSNSHTFSYLTHWIFLLLFALAFSAFILCFNSSNLINHNILTCKLTVKMKLKRKILFKMICKMRKKM